MTRSRSNHARWPFWLLLAAWACANSPQAATYALLGWVSEARAFSHQQRLATEVAFLLGGPSSGARETVGRTLETEPAKPTPAVPVEAVLKKLPLAVERVVEILPPPAQADPWRRLGELIPASFRAAPPHGPPRSVVT